MVSDAAAAQGGDVALVVDPLEAGDDGDLLLAQALAQLGVVDAADARLGEGRVGEDPDLMAEEAAGLAPSAPGWRGRAARSSPARRWRRPRPARARWGAWRSPVASLSRRLVSPAIAETTTTTSWPALRAALARRATLRIRSASADRRAAVLLDDEHRAGTYRGPGRRWANGVEARHADRAFRRRADAGGGGPRLPWTAAHRACPEGPGTRPGGAQAGRSHRRGRRAHLRDQHRVRHAGRGVHRQGGPAQAAAQPDPLPRRRGRRPAAAAPRSAR